MLNGVKESKASNEARGSRSLSKIKLKLNVAAYQAPKASTSDGEHEERLRMQETLLEKKRQQIAETRTLQLTNPSLLASKPVTLMQLGSIVNENPAKKDLRLSIATSFTDKLNKKKRKIEIEKDFLPKEL